MKIRLDTYRVGGQGFFEPGDVIDVPEPEALRLIDTKQATPLQRQSAVIEPPAAAVQPGASPRHAPPHHAGSDAPGKPRRRKKPPRHHT